MRYIDHVPKERSDSPLVNRSIVIEIRGDECVETIAKRKYWSMVDEYIQSGVEDVEIEMKIEMLRKFLEEMDVERYRSEIENYASEGKDAYLRLEMDDDGDVSAEIIHADKK
jgi:predicted ArsR family transcriptional regulator